MSVLTADVWMLGSAPNGEYARAITKTTLVPSASQSDDLVHEHWPADR